MCSKDWTIAWQCSTRDATSHLRKRHHARVSSGASPGEPRTHPSSISPPMVWVANGRPNWRLWMPTTMPSIPSPPPVATGRDEFAKLWVHGARSPRRCRRPGGRRCEHPIATSGRNGTGRVRKAVGPRRKKPTPLQTARWKAVQRAKRKGLSMRGIARELSIHRDTVKKYMNAESPPVAPSRLTPNGP